MQDILNTSEAARYLNLGRSTLEKWRCTGQGPKFIRLGTRRVGYSLNDLSAWVQTRPRFSSTSDAAATP